MGSPLKVYITKNKEDILTELATNVSIDCEKEIILKAKLETLLEVEQLCKERGRY